MNSENIKMGLHVGGIFISSIVCFILVSLIGLIDTKSPNFALTLMYYAGGSIFSAIAAILLLVHAHEDRRKIENEIVRSEVIFGTFSFGIGSAKSSRMIPDGTPKEIDFSKKYMKIPKNDELVKKAFGFTKRKYHELQILDETNSRYDEENGTISVLKDDKSTPIVFTVEDLNEDLKTKLPPWAKYLYEINLKYEYIMPVGNVDISIWTVYIVLAESYYDELRQMDYTLSGLRPFQFIDMMARNAWLVKIGELGSGLEDDKHPYSIPLVTTAMDIKKSENILRKMDISTPGTADEERWAINSEVKGHVIGFMRQQNESLDKGETETIRKLQGIEAESGDLKNENEKLRKENAKLAVKNRELEVAPIPKPPKPPNTISIGGMVAISIISMIAGAGIFMLLAKMLWGV